MKDLDQLSRSLANFEHRSIKLSPQLADLWLATSALQKAIRRGDTTSALKATAVLAGKQPDRLWTRLVVIALEDVGIADLALVHQVLAVSGKRVWRANNGGEEKVAAYFVTQLCRAVKCRDNCDILVVADLHPNLKEQRVEFSSLSANELADVVAGTGVSLPERVLAAWYLAGTVHFPGAQLKDRHGSFRLLSEVYEQLGISPFVLEVANWGATRTREAHPVSLPLIYELATQTSERATRTEAPQSLGPVGDWPSEAYDMHCRPGQRAVSLFLNGVKRGFDRFRKQVTPRNFLDLVGTAIFRVEGAAVDLRLVYPGSDAILAEAEIAHCSWSGLPVDEVEPLLKEITERLPKLHRCRLTVAEVA